MRKLKDKAVMRAAARVYRPGTLPGAGHYILNLETLEETYDCKLLVGKSPLGDLPQVTVVPYKFLK